MANNENMRSAVEERQQYETKPKEDGFYRVLTFAHSLLKSPSDSTGAFSGLALAPRQACLVFHMRTQDGYQADGPSRVFKANLR